MEDIGVLSDNYHLSSNYEKGLDENIKKSLGIYYTPKFIVEYILENTLKNHDILKNPYPRVLDISCGCGNFLLEAYDILYEKFEENRFELKINDIHNHILSNCIYGVDVDEDAINILKQALKNKDIDEDIDKLNIYCFDSLNKNNLDEKTIDMFWENKFDYIVGNPPYIGHKNLEIDYKKWLLKEYSDVYKDKSDIYFCFYKRIIDLLKENGVASIITPRYFLESPSGKHLRNYILDNVKIKEILDFNGANIFKNINVASCIFTMENSNNNNDLDIDVYKLSNMKLDFTQINNLKTNLENSNFTQIKIKQADLKEDWILANKENCYMYSKIEKYAQYRLGDICVSFQGIITGCDKAFVINKNQLRIKKSEHNILKKWIKNKHINKYKIDNNESVLIYSDDIKDELLYKDSIKYISEYKDKLSNRRECKRNIRHWYELQWGRDKSHFERKKIMYPYKSKENRFAIDCNNSFCSADVYSFYIKEEFQSEISYEYLVAILNSNTYDEYFKTFAKKMTAQLYDYYPNKVMNIKIFKDENYLEIEKLSKSIIEKLNSKNIIDEEIIDIQNQINDIIVRSLQLQSLG